YPGRGGAAGRRRAGGGRTPRPAPATAATAAGRAGAARSRTGRTARPHGSPPPHDGPRTTHLGPGNGAVVRHRRGGGRDMRDSHRAEAERLLGRAVEEEVRRTGGRTDGKVLLGRARGALDAMAQTAAEEDRKSTRLNSSHVKNSYAVFCLTKKRA